MSTWKFTENYHTHTARCKHASGCVMDYAIAARDAGLEILGFSDHTPLPDNRWLGVRMEMSELPEYLAEIRAAQEAVPEVRILSGFECEYDPAYHEFYRDELLGTYKMDYLAGGAHWYPNQGEWYPQEGAWYGVGDHGDMDAGHLEAYAAYLVKSITSGIFVYQAHPDLFAASSPVWNADTEACSRTILKAAEDVQMPLEINAYGLRKPWFETPEGERARYPWRKFWEIAAEYNIKVLINSDAHRPEDISAATEDAYQIAEYYGLTLVDMKTIIPALRSTE